MVANLVKKAMDIIKHIFYMDDRLTPVSAVKKAVKLISDAKEPRVQRVEIDCTNLPGILQMPCILLQKSSMLKIS